ncbi:Gypsy retrotransposon integrase-like protein 1, partial [Mucuna pruriens]
MAPAIASAFDSFILTHVPRDQNEQADLLAKLASTQKRGQQRSVIHESLSTPTIDRAEIWHLENRTTWMTPILKYLQDGQIPEESEEAQMIKEAAKYTFVEQHLYRRGFSFPLLRFLEENESAYVIGEVHEGVCGTHIGGRALASKIARAGYHWLTLRQDCMEYVRRCDKCKRFAEGHKAPPERLHSVTSLWPFFKWGVDILGLFPPTPGQVKFLIVVVDYFTKWIEAEPVASISSERVKRLRRRLEEAKGQWAEELPHVLWSYHNTPHSTTNETPFCITFDTEAMVHVEIGEPSPRTALFEPGRNLEELRANLDLIQEAREIAHIREYVVKA